VTELKKKTNMSATVVGGGVLRTDQAILASPRLLHVKLERVSGFDFTLFDK
jgi:hypothetical protein